jgi:hypothetical protein
VIMPTVAASLAVHARPSWTNARARGSYEAREQVHEPDVGDQPDREEARLETSAALRRIDEVPSESQADPAAQSRAIDPYDHRLRAQEEVDEPSADKCLA